MINRLAPRSGRESTCRFSEELFRCLFRCARLFHKSSIPFARFTVKLKRLLDPLNAAKLLLYLTEVRSSNPSTHSSGVESRKRSVSWFSESS